jgi:hypothetical protein
VLSWCKNVAWVVGMGYAAKNAAHWSHLAQLNIQVQEDEDDL